MNRTGRLGIGVIGGGRVGPVLAAALAGAGHAIVGIATVSEANRERVRRDASRCADPRASPSSSNAANW